MEDNDQVKIRRERLDGLRSRGLSPYVNRYKPSHRIAHLLKEHAGRPAEDLEKLAPQVKIAGRLMSIRGHGKTIFGHVQDGSAKIQVYARVDETADFDDVKKLDMGDIVAGEGTLFYTKTGELTVRATRLFLLTKSLSPLPEKWHGLKDVETRYRQRYVDLISNDEVREVFVKRAKVISAIRRYLDSMEFLEVETPMMQPIPGGAAARPFVTHHNALDMQLYMRVAPELYLKRLIVGGYDRVYEINRNFRNEGISTMHNPEFTMLEFYMAYVDYNDLMTMSEKMLSSVAMEVCGTTSLNWMGHDIELGGEWRRCAFFEAIETIGGVPKDVVDDHDKAREWLKARGVTAEKAGKGAKVWEKLFEVAVEPHLVQPTFIYDFPLELSPLAKTKEGAPHLVERFELYIGCKELANAYTELNDPDDQLRRFKEQAGLRDAGDAEAQWMDLDYVTALEYGMPPTGGEGIGIDRLAMLLTGQDSIREVILFPLLKIQKPDQEN
ncbi:MAG: lysine--tRNA ligase [Nitrospinae bacterium]|nr:lysine--tRNA ligase [Nitrospinota bacterium]